MVEVHGMQAFSSNTTHCLSQSASNCVRWPSLNWRSRRAPSARGEARRRDESGGGGMSVIETMRWGGGGGGARE